MASVTSAMADNVVAAKRLYIEAYDCAWVVGSGPANSWRHRLLDAIKPSKSGEPLVKAPGARVDPDAMRHQRATWDVDNFTDWVRETALSRPARSPEFCRTAFPGGEP